MATKLFSLLLLVGPCLMENPRCGDHEYYDSCGTACPLTCQNPIPGICWDVCALGCFCEEGYIREHLNGTCIPRDSCQNSCRDHEVYNSCGSPCPATCSNPSSCAITVCADGCFCEDGYILMDDNSQCVKKDECPTNRSSINGL